ncbi:MAG: ABC transporter permease subunit [Calditrichaeota bacterium]|nr:ABC transporter permease subunit [Calditrichota bacterium]
MLLRSSTRSKLAPYLFLAVPLIIYLIWVIGPMFYSFYLSLTRWDGLSKPVFWGFKNYRRLFHDPVFFISLKNNLKWVVSFITIPVVCGLLLAMALNRAIPGEKFFKASFYSPMVLSLVVCGLIWSWMYHPASGLINSVLRLLGLESLTRGWLSDNRLVLWAIITVAIWRQVGYVMVLYLAGLKSVDPSLVDASRVDGANSWQTFWRVIFPQLAPITVIVLVISIIDSLRAFDLVSIMTRGGPYNSSSVLANFMYIESFNNYKMGYGASISVIQFLISLGFIFIYLQRVIKSEGER